MIARGAWPVFRTELLRGTAPVVAAGSLLAGLVVMNALAADWAGWAGRWMPLAASVRMSLLALGTLAVAAAAWQAGRDRRRRIGDQLAATPRPAWQPFVLAWAAVTLGALLALLLIVGVSAALVAPVASYSGGGWWWVLAVAFPGLAALSALGAAAGRVIPSRLTAPAVAIGVYLLMVGLVDTSGLGMVQWAVPVMSQYDAPGFTLATSVSLAQFVLFSAAAATAITVVAAARRWLALAPAAVALGAGMWLSSSTPEWQLDHSALEPVCTDDGGPDVCVTRMNGFLLDDVTEPARGFLERWEGIPGGADRAVERLVSGAGDDSPDSGGALSLNLSRGATISGRLADIDEYGDSMVHWWPATACAEAAIEEHWTVIEVGASWGAQSGEWLDPGERSKIALDRLLDMPVTDQKDWMGRFLAAAETCDEQVLITLDEELR